MKLLATAALLAAGLALPASAAILNVNDVQSSAGTSAAIIPAPASVADDAPGRENTGMEGFNEAQGFTLLSDLSVDGGSILAGTTVNSHMIFLNTAGGGLTTHGFGQDGPVVWTFDGDILGVMSDANGGNLAASDSFLGAAGTDYFNFSARGLEGDPLSGFNDDFYSFSGNMLTIGMRVTEPGDWVRVITAPAPIPLPAAGWMLLAGLGGLGALSRRRKI